MPRPKGSKNKPKTKVETKPITNGGQYIAEAYPSDDLEKDAETVIENALKDPEVITTATGCKGCGHPQNTHYGPKDNPSLNWCNNSGCKCLAFEI